MAFGLTETGFNRKTLIEIKTDIENRLKAIPEFGPNIDLDPQSKFGQQVGIFSEAFSDRWQTAEDIYNSQYPSTASGAALANVVQYNGIKKQEAAFSTIEEVVLTGTPGTFIEQGSQASVVSTGSRFATDEDAEIGIGGTVTVSMTAVLTGPIAAAAGTLTVIESPTFGWTAVNNITDAEIGRNEEEDPELRIRREVSVAASGQNNIDALFGQLSNLNNVVDVVIIDNKDSETDEYGVPPNRFESIIQGGAEEDITAIIWTNTTTGIKSHGDITVIIQDSQGFDQEVSYSRPIEIPIYFSLTITVNEFFPIDGEDQLKENIVTYGEDTFKIGDDVIYIQFFTPINEVPGIVTLDLRIGTTPSPTGTANIEIDLTELSTYSITNVGVTIV
jgi:uncharacterized phage protein gp47/JayE